MPGDDGPDEAGQVGHRELVGGRADDVGGRPPARAEHHGDVVRRDAGGLREGGGRRRGGGLGHARQPKLVLEINAAAEQGGDHGAMTGSW